MSIWINLTKGYKAKISREDENLRQFKWTAQVNGSRVYAYRRDRVTRKKVYLHKQVLLAEEVDHIDGNTLNNCRSNLRSATRSQNNANRKKGAGTSQYKGVSRDRSRGKWKAQIKHKGKGRFLGRFETEKEAAAAYDKEARKLFGEFARTNL